MNIIAEKLATEVGRYELAMGLGDMRVTIDTHHKDPVTGMETTIAILNIGNNIVAFGNPAPSRSGNGNYVINFNEPKEKVTPQTQQGAAAGLGAAMGNLQVQQPAQPGTVVQMPGITNALNNLPSNG